MVSVQVWGTWGRRFESAQPDICSRRENLFIRRMRFARPPSSISAFARKAKSSGGCASHDVQCGGSATLLTRGHSPRVAQPLAFPACVGWRGWLDRSVVDRTAVERSSESLFSVDIERFIRCMAHALVVGYIPTHI